MRHKGQNANPKTRIDELTEELNRWAKAYYVEDNPEVPDAAYDAALQGLRDLEDKFPTLKRPDSPSYRVGSGIKDAFKKHRHLQPMLSLANVFSNEDVEAFFDRARRFLKQYIGKMEVLI
jgi:DNA ligase (NAD+)